MKISIFLPKSEFNKRQVAKLKSLGRVTFTLDRSDLSDAQLKKHAAGADIIGIDPDNFAGFENALTRVFRMAESLPHLKGISLSTTSFGWVDLQYFKDRKIPICNIPGYSRESVAEHTLTLLLGLAKRIFITDRRTQKGRYRMEMGFELQGKTLGIIGLDSIGTATAELAKGIGMKVIAYNRTPKTYPGVEMKSTLKELLREADAIAIHITHEAHNKHLLNNQTLAQVRPGVIIVNTADREAVDESAMAVALKRGHVDSYAVEVEDMENTPLKNLENAVLLRGFAWYTKEALSNLSQIFVDNIEKLALGHPQNVVNP